MIKRVALFLCLIVAVLIVGAVVVCLWLNQQAPKRIEAAKQRLREMGAPMTLEAGLLPSVADEENAALLYLELADFIENTAAVSEANDLIEQQLFGDYETDWEDVYRMELSDAEWTTLGEALEMLEQTDYFVRIEAIAARPYFRPDWDFEQGPAMLIPEVGQAMGAARWCLARASVQMRASQPVAALADLSVVYTLSDQMAQGQTLINVLTSCAIRGMADESLEAMSRGGHDLTGLDASVWDFAMMDYWVPALDLERLGMGRVCFETLLYGSDEKREALLDGGPNPLYSFGYFGLIRWFFEYDYATYLNLMADVREQVDLSPTELQAADAQLEVQMMEAKRRYRILTCILMPTTYHIQIKLMQAEARDRLAVTGLALSAYHAAHDVYSNSLADLVPNYLAELPLDPFTGQPLVYKTVGAEYALYSVGANGSDDDGLQQESDKSDEGDLIWAGAGSALTREPYEE